MRASDTRCLGTANLLTDFPAPVRLALADDDRAGTWGARCGAGFWSTEAGPGTGTFDGSMPDAGNETGDVELCELNGALGASSSFENGCGRVKTDGRRCPRPLRAEWERRRRGVRTQDIPTAGSTHSGRPNDIAQGAAADRMRECHCTSD